MAGHFTKCKLPYSVEIGREASLVIYRVDHKHPIRVRKFVQNSVLEVMQQSKEISADQRGWYAKMEKQELEEFQTHVYVAVKNGFTAGTAIVNLKRAIRVDFSNKDAERVIDKIPRWCVCRVWVVHEFRRQGIGQQMVASIARHLQVSVEELAWMAPLSSAGTALARAIAGDILYLTA
jgi:GNAT superfamily N-acetyltransferase